MRTVPVLLRQRQVPTEVQPAHPGVHPQHYSVFWEDEYGHRTRRGVQPLMGHDPVLHSSAELERGIEVLQKPWH